MHALTSLAHLFMGYLYYGQMVLRSTSNAIVQSLPDAFPMLRQYCPPKMPILNAMPNLAPNSLARCPARLNP